MIKCVPEEARIFMPQKIVKCRAEAIFDEADSETNEMLMLRSGFEGSGNALVRSSPFEQECHMLEGGIIVTMDGRKHRIGINDVAILPLHIGYSTRMPRGRSSGSSPYAVCQSKRQEGGKWIKTKS